MDRKPTMLACRQALKGIMVERGIRLTEAEIVTVAREAMRLMGIRTVFDRGAVYANGAYTPGRPYGGFGYLPTADEQVTWRRSDA